MVENYEEPTLTIEFTPETPSAIIGFYNDYKARKITQEEFYKKRNKYNKSHKKGKFLRIITYLKTTIQKVLKQLKNKIN